MGSNIHINYEVGQNIGNCQYLGNDIIVKYQPRKASFKCKCGKIFVAEIKKVKSGHTKSCGCLLINTITKHGHAKRGHETREYRIWQHMVDRCNNPFNENYTHYGGRGVKVCERWVGSFSNFFADMGECTTPKHSLDRVNNNGNYEPSNCRWATQAQQCRNKRDNHWIEYNGRRMILTDWAHEAGITSNSLKQRIYKLNWSLEKSLTNIKIKKELCQAH